ncbi:hypothetical protein D2E26_1415 [Bifidobacterium dolichotidis]|uniref:Uncharacterized protein n=1 Tax=Bifidobacterium dolichotidis TaxID=2306976 RepID=A0A430FKE8_9BIFI|nr:hypothetical protein [Bifidobacterium dolichotidis]RSX53373.1 hypothetical protein D2E26_1415 [Bifidobacterium dolichotidis]
MSSEQFPLIRLVRCANVVSFLINLCGCAVAVMHCHKWSVCFTLVVFYDSEAMNSLYDERLKLSRASHPDRNTRTVRGTHAAHIKEELAQTALNSASLAGLNEYDTAGHGTPVAIAEGSNTRRDGTEGTGTGRASTGKAGTGKAGAKRKTQSKQTQQQQTQKQKSAPSRRRSHAGTRPIGRPDQAAQPADSRSRYRGPTLDNPLIHCDDLPGRLSHEHLVRAGVLQPIDEYHSFLVASTNSLYGRARLLKSIMPTETIACATTAAWVWIGGDFPDSFDVVSSAHYRKTIYDRPVRPFARAVRPEHISEVGSIAITSPVRTACDLAMLPADEFFTTGLDEVTRKIMTIYGVTNEECLAVLHELKFLPNTQQAERVFAFFGVPAQSDLWDAGAYEDFIQDYEA